MEERKSKHARGDQYSEERSGIPLGTPQKDEGEIPEMDKEAVKEEITKNVTNT